MESREVESCILSGMLISGLGWYDFWRKGGGLYVMIGLFGLTVAIAAVVIELRDRKKKS